MNLDESILDAIKAKPGQKAKDIATQLGVDRRTVNSALYGRLRAKVKQDKAYRWYLKGASGIDQREKDSPKQLDTPLAKLCSYYLDCLSYDDVGGVSEFASSNYGSPYYTEVKKLPVLDDTDSDPFDSEDGRQLLARIKRDRNRRTIFLGYPVRLNHIRSRRTSWEGFKVEPLFLFPFQETQNRYSTPRLSDDLPQINFQALRSLSNAGDANLMEEVIQLSEELGLVNVSAEQPDLDELFSRLRQIRTDWDWQEDIDPYVLSSGASLSELNQQGIYNRAILVASERSPYTKGLESELGMLQSIPESKYRETALGSWLSGKTIESPPADQLPLLEVLPLNSEQRQAVRQALTNPLTVVTGPPGTGKSQVVTSILVNAAWQGKTVLFASKNNKAVDVVETRVNSLGPRPVLLRLGANEYQTRLATYLMSLLAATATADDHDRYSECETVHGRLQERSDKLDAAVQALIQIRNEVDASEQSVEQIRHEIGEKVFRLAKTIHADEIKQAAVSVQEAIEQADRSKQPFFTRLLWPLIRGQRFENLVAAVEPHRELANRIDAPMPEGAVDSVNINDWIGYGPDLSQGLTQIAQAQSYFVKLELLKQAPPLEELSRMRKELTDDLSSNSDALWQAWLRLQPARLSPGQRSLLSDYSALLQMIVSANNNNRQLGRDVFRRYYQLFPKIMPILSCWAVTSLSARGRVPFEPTFVDLLIVDEASQCDIASAIPLLFRARRVVVIGDPKQLRHISSLSKQQDQQLLNKHGLVENHAKWAHSSHSLFDLTGGICRSEDIINLRDHHRSHVDIIEFSNEAFYEGQLRVATRYDRLQRPWKDEPAVRWINVQGKTVRPGTGGAINEEEARAVVQEIERLVGQGYRGSIGVVSPFRAQANRIRDLVYQHDGLGTRIAELDFLADTVHKFQGDERDVMIFSPVVSNGVVDSALGFLRSNPNLFNVAITRARAALLVVGDRTAAITSKVDYLSGFASYVGRISDNQRMPEPTTRMDYGPEYPTVSRPELVSEWERHFYRSIYSAGIRSIPQYAVEKYILDFAVFNGEKRFEH